MNTEYGSFPRTPNETDESKKSFFTILLGATGVSLLMALAATYSFVSSVHSQTEMSEFELLRVVAWNEYGSSEKVLQNTPYSKLQLPNIVLIEPYRDTKLVITGGGNNEQDFIWTVRQGPPDLQRQAPDPSHLTIKKNNHGSDTAFCTMPGSYTVELQSLTTTKQFLFSCLYVKREMRQLTIADREKFLDAMIAIWRSPDTETGRLIYPTTSEGYQFLGIDRLVTAHHRESSGSVWCDKWHDGTGFLFHHLAFGLAFESSMRAVDKSATMPYWDFTIEGEALARDGKGPSGLLKINPWILSSTWFGETIYTGGPIVNSRWKGANATKAIPSTKNFANAMGYMRAPWNMNPTPYVSRAVSYVCDSEPVNKPIPTCATHLELAQMDSLQNFLSYVAGDGHGPMHVNLGGVFGDCSTAMNDLRDRHADELAKKIETKALFNLTGDSFELDGIDNHKEQQKLLDVFDAAFGLEFFHVYRMLYRSQSCATDGEPSHLDCRCENDDDPSTCTCMCRGIREGTFDWRVVEPCAYVSDSARTILQNTLSDDIREDLITTMCSVGQVQEGEMLESGSPSDPLFFTIHPAIDRLTIAKRFPMNQNPLPFANLGYFKSLDGQDYWEPWSYYGADRCIGHGPDDQALAYDLEQGLSYWIPRHFDDNNDQVISNREFWHAIHPLYGALDYIYDNFDWHHCNSENDSIEHMSAPNSNHNKPSKPLMINVDCSLYDDDTIYPSIPNTEPSGYTNCEIQDSGAWCDTCQSSTTCLNYCSEAMALCDHNSNGAFQFVNPCLWEMVANLPQVCADTFHAAPPLQSNNIGFTVKGPYTEPTWNCNWHSMCQACSDPDEPEGLNKYCRAVIFRNQYHANGGRLFLEDLESEGTSFWCQADVLRSIDDGSFFIDESIGATE